ncbi:hypothetical protein LCAZH_0366 [Lacticaseibacillus paracasei]|nr:hypothetical protein LCAZH_0366 [Lacticaseibacillus paracasei]AGP67107.1 Hypothetical protein LOCK919_0356 [Lacticaseibacillus paracasei]EKQ01862.1 hypothetical protein LCA12A_2573 [Lacticaseibacillus casei 12A]EKQ04555.1 hypothetical protein LCA211_0201 [Lacticaseibacillus casei 21/1]EPC26007.1 hypothetical protein Lpp46_1839 [Lacticaseibacillus paracasei subsp. paracasei Lpp46]
MRTLIESDECESACIFKREAKTFYLDHAGFFLQDNFLH